MDFNNTDIIVILTYVAVILYIGFYIARKKDIDQKNSSDEFLLAGRKVTLPLFIATLVATWYGNILGAGEFIFSSGLVAWVCFAFPYYIAATIFAYLVAGKIRASNTRTIPEQIEKKFGPTASVISSVIVIIITIPAAYILMLGVLIQMLSGWELWICIVLGTVITMAYLFTGGFKADVLTNTAQFVLMYIGFGVLLYYTIDFYGSIGDMTANLPSEHLEPFGGASWQFIAAWFIISLQTFIDPGFHQRCAAAKSPGTAKKGILISVGFWVIFDIMTLATGLYAKSYLSIDNPLMAFPTLGNAVLPHFWKGIFFVALLSTIMSTLDSYAFISAATIGNDLLKRLKKKVLILSIASTEALTKIGLLITGLFGIVMSIMLPSAVGLIYKTSSVAVPALLIPMMLTYSERYKARKSDIIIIMSTSAILSLIWTLGNITAQETIFPFSDMFINVEPMMPGLLLSLILASFMVKKAK